MAVLQLFCHTPAAAAAAAAAPFCAAERPQSVPRSRTIVNSLAASHPPSSSASLRDGRAWRRTRSPRRRGRRRRNSSAAAQEADEVLGGGEFEVGEALEGMLRNDASKNALDGLAEKTLRDDEESRALLQDFASAAERVARAAQELDSIDRQEKDLSQLMSRAAEAASVVAEEEEEVRAAEEELKAAEIALVTARAGGSLSDSSSSKWESGGIDDDLERVESGKAAAVSVLAGTLASLPFVFSTAGGIGVGSWVSVGGVALSCALFGVTYRYVLRRDLGNVQLKLGAAAAFALVRGIGQLDAIQRYVGYPVTPGAEEAGLAALGVLEGLLSFGFSALALDYCLREALVAPFPSRKRS